MNYYERIQRSIDYVEENLENKIELSKVAAAAYMSLANYYRLFFALTGHTVKDYIRRRRISLSVEEMESSQLNLLEIALKYGYENGDSFSRAFKRIVGCSPTDFKRNEQDYCFRRVNVMDKYFDIQNPELLERFPEIKILKELEPMKVAYYCFFGQEPEDNAFKVVSKWLRHSGLNMEKHKLRFFGYNNPSPSKPDQKEYGYEVCVTIPDYYEVDDKLVKEKILPGGLYAVCAVKKGVSGGSGCDIAYTWERFSEWLKDSKYTLGNHQWLEEHLQFNGEFEHIAGMDLYMPIKKTRLI
ncbi:MAG: AraC family transcriptional regulator [Bacillus sp. (in: Bacteria)]|nr:AraC family transcriptional regulator [Bacillus sp. (in: firmicutes)]